MYIETRLITENDEFEISDMVKVTLKDGEEICGSLYSLEDQDITIFIYPKDGEKTGIRKHVDWREIKTVEHQTSLYD